MVVGTGLINVEIPMCVNWAVGILGLFIICPALFAQTAPRAPVARQVEHISVWHGEKVNDPFFWLREKSNPEVIQYLEAENAYTEAMTKDIQPFADALYKEMLGHIKQTDLTVPVRRGAYFYYSRTEEGKQYPIQCRKKLSPDGLGRGGPRGSSPGPERAGQGLQVPLAREPSR